MSETGIGRWVASAAAVAMMLGACGSSATPAATTTSAASAGASAAASVPPTAEPTSVVTPAATPAPVGSPASTPASPSPTSASPDPTPASTPTASAPVSQRMFGRITKVDPAGQSMTVKLAEMLSGDAAVAAAVADGAIKAGERLDNDYYIRQLGTTGTYTVNSSTQIVILAMGSDGNPTPAPATLTKFANLLKQGVKATGWYYTEYWWIDVISGHASKIQAQYLP